MKRIGYSVRASWITGAQQKPQTCVWSLATAEHALQDWDAVSQEIWPEQLPDGKWRVGEISMNPGDRPALADGTVYIYDDRGDCIFEQSAPALPKGDFQFYQISQQGVYAHPIPFKKLRPGQYLVSYRDTLQLRNAEDQVISPEQTDYYVSEIMSERVGHEYIERFEIDVPVTIIAGAFQHRIERNRRRISHPRLSGAHRVPNTSKRIPPVYTSNEVYIDFSEISVTTTSLNVHIWGSTLDTYEPFDAHAVMKEEGFRLNLSQLIPSAQIDTYAVEVTHGYRTGLMSPIEFSVLPNLCFGELADDNYNPLNLPRIAVSHLTAESVGAPDGSARVEALCDGERIVTWTDLRSPYCRLYITKHERTVSVEWQIERIYAWLEGTADKTILDEKELETAQIQFCGRPKSELHLYAGDYRHKLAIGARGEVTAGPSQRSVSRHFAQPAV